MTNYRPDLMPELFQFFGGLYPDCEDQYLDPADYVEGTLGAGDDLTLVRDQLRSLLAELPEEAALAKGLDQAGVHTSLPIGDSWRAWGEALLERLDEAVADPSTVIPWTDGWFERRFPPAPATFLDEETANTAATEVLRAHEERFRSWSADTQGSYRLHLYADLGRVVGHLPADDGVPGEAVTGAVVLLKMDHASGTPFILTAYPERPLDIATRERFPDLTTMFGGYLGQDWGHADRLTWNAMVNFHHTTRPPARDRVTTQLDDLLTITDDDQLRAAAAALGAYALPVHLRAWLVRTRDYLDRFPPNAPRTPSGG